MIITTQRKRKVTNRTFMTSERRKRTKYRENIGITINILGSFLDLTRFDRIYWESIYLNASSNSRYLLSSASILH